MSDSSETKNNKVPVDKNNLSTPHVISNPPTDPSTPEIKSEVITEKFLTVAKEKNYLESVIMSQNDVIKGLEKEKEELTLTLRKFSASHKSMKEKLLDFDILRNMEISELKKKIEHLMTDNKKLLSEKDSILRNLERDQKNISRAESQVVESLLREKSELEELLKKTQADSGSEQGSNKASLASLLKTVEDLEKSIAAGELDLEQTRDSLKTASDSILALEHELALAQAQLEEIKLDRDEARAELYKGRVEFDHLKADKNHVEENLQTKIDDYNKEIADLKTDIDELTSAIESKICVIDELNAKVVNLSSELSHKDIELHERIPSLVDKINSLSQSIDMKMEENSLFAKELFDLNVKIATLNEEIIEKDKLLIEISEEYKTQKDEYLALHGAHELTLRNLVSERDLLKKENEELRDAASTPLQELEKEQQERRVLQDRVAEMQITISELGLENSRLMSLISAKDTAISDLKKDVLLLSSRIEDASTEHASSLAAAREQLSTLEQQLHEKNEMLTVMSAERSQAADKDQVIADLQSELLLYQSKLDKATAEHALSLAAAREQLSTLEQQFHEKNEMLTVMSAERSQAANRDQVIADLQSELLLYQSKLDKATAEHASSLAAVREKIVLLNQQLLEKNELITVMASEHESRINENLVKTDLLRKERTALAEDMNRLMTRERELELSVDEYKSMLDTAKNEKAGLEEDLTHAAEKINELVLKQESLHTLSARTEQALSGARAEISVLQASKAELENMLKDKQEITDTASVEKEALQKTALEYQETFEHLKQEIISLNMKLAEKEQTLNLLLSEKEHLVGDITDHQEKLEQSLASIALLQTQLADSRRESMHFSGEHSDLLKALTGLQIEISSLNRARQEEVKALKADLSLYGKAVADLRLRFELGLEENADLRSRLQASLGAGRDIPISIAEKREETLPARVAQIASPVRRSLVYALLVFVLLGGLGFYYYSFNTGRITLPMQSPVVRSIAVKDLDYADMFSMLTKVSATDDLKFQATLLTEALVLSSDIPGEKSLFNFQNHLYFKVSISAPKDRLDVKIVDDPYPIITMTVGGATVKPLTDIHVKDKRTFYRKEEPVSIMFYCAFPRTALSPDDTSLSLSFNINTVKTDITWDLKSLRASSLLP